MKRLVYTGIDLNWDSMAVSCLLQPPLELGPKRGVRLHICGLAAARCHQPTETSLPLGSVAYAYLGGEELRGRLPPMQRTGHDSPAIILCRLRGRGL